MAKHAKTSPTAVSAKLKGIQSRNLQNNDTTTLLRKIKQLEDEFQQSTQEFADAKNDNGRLKEQNDYMREINKRLFEKLTELDPQEVSAPSLETLYCRCKADLLAGRKAFR